MSDAQGAGQRRCRQALTSARAERRSMRGWPRSKRPPSSTPMRWIMRWRRSKPSANQRATDQVESQRRAAQHEEALHRLEDSIARLEMRLPDAEFERRLDGIERSVSGMADRLEHYDPAERFDTSMQALSHRLERWRRTTAICWPRCARSCCAQSSRPPTNRRSGASRRPAAALSSRRRRARSKPPWPNRRRSRRRPSSRDAVRAPPRTALPSTFRPRQRRSLRAGGLRARFRRTSLPMRRPSRKISWPRPAAPPAPPSEKAESERRGRFAGFFAGARTRAPRRGKGQAALSDSRHRRADRGAGAAAAWC